MPSERILFDSPLVRIGHFVLSPEERDWHEENIIRGTVVVFPTVPVRIRQAGHEGVIADRNVVMYYNAGNPYERELLHPRGDEAVWFALKPDLAGPLVGEFEPGAQDRPEAPFASDHGPSSNESYLRHQMLRDHLLRQPAPDGLQIEEAAIGIVRSLLGAAHCLTEQPWRARRAETARSRRELSERVREMLALDPGHAWSIGEIADRVCVSPGHLTRVFRQVTGLSLHQYVTNLRMREASEAVLAGERDLAVLAARLGFCTHSHMTDVFRRAYGITPTSLRRPEVLDRLLRDAA